MFGLIARFAIVQYRRTVVRSSWNTLGVRLTVRAICSGVQCAVSTRRRSAFTSRMRSNDASRLTPNVVCTRNAMQCFLECNDFRHNTEYRSVQ